MKDQTELLMQLTQQSVYLMGISFILGSLCTIFVLLILDMVRRGMGVDEDGNPLKPVESELAEIEAEVEADKEEHRSATG